MDKFGLDLYEALPLQISATLINIMISLIQIPIMRTRNRTISLGSGVSNFIGSDRKVAPYHLVVF